MSADTSGPGRRLTPEQEQRAAELFAAGRSEREVADELGCSASTAHRLRERLERAGGTPDEPEAPAAPARDEHEAAGAFELTAQHPLRESPGELGELQAERDRLADLLQTYGDRAAASRQALADLETERVELLTEGKDAAPLRPRRADAEADLADSETSAQIAADRVAAVDVRIAQVRAMRDLAEMRDQLEAAVAERDTVCAATGDRMRAAVLAVRRAAEEFTAALADERAATERTEQLGQDTANRALALGERVPVAPPARSTALWVDNAFSAGKPVALSRAISEARIGRTEAVATCLGEAFGWLPPDPAVIAAERERMRQLRTAPPPSPPSVEHPAHWPAAVSVDSHGRPLAPPDPERQRAQTAVRPGALGFTPWPG
jgi:Homeodomain-like domain